MIRIDWDSYFICLVIWFCVTFHFRMPFECVSKCFTMQGMLTDVRTDCKAPVLDFWAVYS